MLTVPLPHGEPLHQFLDRTTASLQAQRQPWEAHWQEVADSFAPAGYESQTMANRASEKLHQFVYDATSQIVVQRAVAGLLGHITPKGRDWYAYGIPWQTKQERASRHRTMAWLADTTKQSRKALAASNFYDVAPTVYEQAFAFGTGSMLIVRDPERVIHCYPLLAGGYWLAVDSRGFPSTCLRSFKLTVAQMVEQFGEEHLGIEAKRALHKGDLGREFEVRHLIYPRDPRMRMGPAGSKTAMPFASVYYDQTSVQTDGPLSVGGFNRMPVVSVPWHRVGLSPYGRSPCMMALPFDRQLQSMTLTKGEVAAIMAKPPVQAPAELKNQRIDMESGGITYYDQSTQYGGVRPLIERPADITPLREDILDIRDQIRSALYVDLFLALQRIDQRMTAREIDARVREGLAMLGPVVHNMDTYFLSPTLDNVYDALLEGGALLPFPEEMAGAQFFPEYMGVLHLAQKASEMDGVHQFLQTVQAVTVATNQPDAADRIDADAIVDIAVESLGVTPAAARSLEDVQPIREARAAMQAAQARADAVQQQAMAARDAANAPTDGENALTDGTVQGVR